MSISAAVSIITIENKEVLILKRAINPLDPWSGHLSLPGGKIEADDASPLDAAIRETMEECNILLNKCDAIELRPEAAGQRKDHFIKVAPFHFPLEKRPVIDLFLEEHSEFYWVPMDYLRNLDNHLYGNLSKDHPEREFSYIMVHGTPLWGFTYKVLSDFFNWHR
ncbi:MAG: NUDIX domain-containing protein [Lentisphaeraceae bacterium]|nr:NUDIX domain-containing protein [Lentisphaeraceae bacterium]